jgi:hypothetical protein
MAVQTVVGLEIAYVAGIDLLYFDLYKRPPPSCKATQSVPSPSLAALHVQCSGSLV